MIQKLVLPVDTTNGTRFKEGDLIVYNEKNQYFYKTTKENLFYKEQQERKEFIENINKTMNDFIDNINKVIQDMQNSYKLEISTNNKNITNKIQEVDNYMNEISKNYNQFLEEFKETNTKLIEMVEKVIV